MLTRRHFLEVAVAAAAVTGLGQRLPKAAASQAIREQDLLRFDAKGQSPSCTWRTPMRS